MALAASGSRPTESPIGRYVALRGNQLVAEAASRRELMDELEAMEPLEEVLIVPLIEMGSMVVVEGGMG